MNCGRLALALAVALLGAAGVGRSQTTPEEYVAFRVDDHRAIAVLKTLSNAPPYRGSADVEPPVRFGFAPFDPPDAWKKWIPPAIRLGDRWRLHIAPGTSVSAVAERIVGGQPACEGAIGVLLEIAPEDAVPYAEVKLRYYVASPSAAAASPLSFSQPIGRIAAVTPDGATRSGIDAALAQVLRAEHPAVRAESDADFARMASHGLTSQQGRARRWKEMDDALARGAARLQYDVQSVMLQRDAPPLYFVRAYWMVGSRQAFAAAVWIRGVEPYEVVEANIRPAAWLRMNEFQGTVAREHLGLVLNALDRDGDGWGEVLFAQGGYESLGIALREYSAKGFLPQEVQYSYGC